MTTATAADDAVLDPGRAPTSAGTGRPGRMVGLDVARGIALLGMVSVHVQLESTAWWTTVASGRASVLFITLAGLVVSMLYRRGSGSAQPSYLRRRGWALVAAGLLMVNTYWGSTILHYYGVLFLLAPFLLRWSTRRLAVVAAAAITIGPVLIVAIEPHLGWVDSLPTTSLVVMSTLVQMTAGLYPLPVWIGFFLVGIIVGRLDLARWRNALVLAGVGTVLAFTATLVSDALPWHSEWWQESSSAVDSSDDAGAESKDEKNVRGWLSTSDGSGFIVSRAADGNWATVEALSADAGGATDWSSLNDLTPHSNRTPWALQSLGIALALIGLLVALPRGVLRLLRPLAAVGSMTLSAYIVHPFFVQDVWEWAGAADHPGRQAPLLLGIFAVLILGAMAIRARWSQGPFEWLLKKVSGRPTSPVAATAPTTIEPEMPAPSSLRTVP